MAQPLLVAHTARNCSLWPALPLQHLACLGNKCEASRRAKQLVYAFRALQLVGSTSEGPSSHMLRLSRPRIWFLGKASPKANVLKTQCPPGIIILLYCIPINDIDSVVYVVWSDIRQDVRGRPTQPSTHRRLGESTAAGSLPAATVPFKLSSSQFKLLSDTSIGSCCTTAKTRPFESTPPSFELENRQPCLNTAICSPTKACNHAQRYSYR